MRDEQRQELIHPKRSQATVLAGNVSMLIYYPPRTFMLRGWIILTDISEILNLNTGS